MLSQKFERYGRIITEKYALRLSSMAMLFASATPNERFKYVLKQQPELLQKVPQKYIANYIGIKPESLSRLRKRILLKEKS